MSDYNNIGDVRELLHYKKDHEYLSTENNEDKREDHSVGYGDSFIILDISEENIAAKKANSTDLLRSDNVELRDIEFDAKDMK